MNSGIARAAALAVLIAACAALPLPTPAEDFGTRTVQGVVTGEQGRPVEGAAVSLENLATSALRSYLTQADGRYVFHRVNNFQDYRLSARYQGRSGESKTLSRFDTSDPAVVNLKVPAGR